MKSIFIIFFILIHLPLCGQIITFKLNRPSKYTLKYLRSSEKVIMNTDTIIKYKYQIKKDIEYVIKTYSFDYPNYMYWKYLSGTITKEYFERYKILYKINEDIFFKSRRLHSEICILYKKQKDGKISYTFDTNCNNNFTDEKEYTEEDLLNISFIEINNTETYVKGKIIKNTVFVNKFHGNYDTDTIGLNDFEKKWVFPLQLKPYKWAHVQLGNTSLNAICSYNTYYGLEFNKTTTKFYFIQDNIDYKSVIPLRFTDTFYVYDKKIVIDSIDKRGDFLRIKVLKNQSQIKYGFNIGNTIKNVALRFTDSSQLDFSKKTSKYILLDFWGTWCVPCMKMYPMIDSLKLEIDKTKFKDSIIYINIATETQQSLAKYKEMMLEKYHGWRNFLIIDNKNNLLIQKLNIQAYPTVILVSPNNIILNRITGIDEFDKLKKQLANFLQ